MITGYGVYDSSAKHYEGHFLDGKFEGEGKLIINSNKRTYKGTFKNNKFIKGTCHFAEDNSTYNGEWQDEKMHGVGVIYYSDGKIFIGEFRED